MAGGGGKGTLQITPSGSSGEELIRAIREAGLHDEVLSFDDDLSCGPIDPDDPGVRAAWWAPFVKGGETQEDNRAFWNRIEASDERLVVWYGRHASMDQAFFLYWADRAGERPFNVVDVTGRQFPTVRRDGFAGMSPPARAVGLMDKEHLKSLLGSERPCPAQERLAAREQWRQLRRENAYFRIVSADGLISVPANYFDRLILDQTSAEWKTVRLTVGYAMVMADEADGFIQVGDTMVLARIVSLIGEGKLLVEGDQRDIWSCRVRLPI